MKQLAFILLAAVVVAGAQAQESPTAGEEGAGEAITYLTGERLLGFCAIVDSSTPERALCEGYLAGLMDATSTLWVWRRANLKICIPEETSPFQLRNTFLGWIDNNAGANLKVGAGSIALDAFRQKYPCR